MLKNIVKKIKGVAKKAAPYAGIVAGMFGASPLAAAGIGALVGGLGGGAKGAVGGGLGGYFSGSMFGGQNRLFNTGLTNKLFGIQNAGTGGFFNPMNKGMMDLFTGVTRTPGEMVFDTATRTMVPTAETVSKSGLERIMGSMTTDSILGKKLSEDSMLRFLPAAGLGVGALYAAGAFDEEEMPEDMKPKEYQYDPLTDPLKEVNKRFKDYYQGITTIPSSSIYGYLQSIGALKDGGVPRAYSGGGSTAFDRPTMMENPMMMQNPQMNNPMMMPQESALGMMAFKDGKETASYPGAVDSGMNLDPAGMGSRLGTNMSSADQVLEVAAQEALKNLAGGEDTDKKKMPPEVMDMLMDYLLNQFMRDKMQEDDKYRKPPKLNSMGVPILEAANGYRGKPSDDVEDPAIDVKEIENLMEYQNMSYEEALEYLKSIKYSMGGQIMGPGTGRQDIIPGKIVDRNTGNATDMLVSNNEHIIPEYTLYAMGGGDTEKGHEMLNKLRADTKSIATKMGYDFDGAEKGTVNYG